MSEHVMHMPPVTGAVVRAQLRVMSNTLRWILAVIAIPVVLVTVIVVRNRIAGAESLDFHHEQLTLPALLGALLPALLWMREGHFGDGFLWTLPVDRRKHALSRIFAGWLWLMATLFAFFVWLLVLTLISGENIFAPDTYALLPADVRARMDAFPYPSLGAVDPATFENVTAGPHYLLWLVPFTGATALYLLSSAFVVGVRYPLRWIFGIIAAFLLAAGLAEASGANLLLHLPEYTLRPLMLGRYGLDTVITARTEYLKVGATLANGDSVIVWRDLPDVREWALATLMWLALALLAVWLAASRHREHRRA